MDIKILYPIPSDFLNHIERREPELFNYCCIHGSSVVLRAKNKHYVITTCNWIPSFAKDKITTIDPSKSYHDIFTSDIYDSARLFFYNMVFELLQYKRQSSDLELF